MASTPVSGSTPASPGATDDSAADIIRRHLSGALAGPNWNAIIAALGTADEANWDNARSAFDQLFVSSASGKYLDMLAANVGISRPRNVGISDELFRALVIKLSTNKVTHQALREIMEVFYGRDALRASAETALSEPFALSENYDLSWTVDETEEHRIQFTASQFNSIAAATAVELATVLTKTMQDAGSAGFAVAVVDTETGTTKVRIYSGSLGLKSFVRITAGRAQSFLRFPTYVEVYGGTVTNGLGYSWVYTVPQQNVTRLSLTTAGQPLVDVNSVQVGDYLVIGPTGSIPGTYSVRAIATSWSGGNLTQTVDLDADLGFTGSVTQQGNDDYRFFRPTKQTILSGDRTVVVAQTTQGQIDIQIPATTQAVNRTVHTGAYGRVNASVGIGRYLRDKSGTVTVTPDTAFSPVPAVGSTIIVDGVKTIPARPWVSKGTPGSHPTVATADASYGTTWSATQTPPSVNNEESKGVLLANGDLLIVGGRRRVGGGPLTSSLKTNRFRLSTEILVTDGSEATNALRRQYQWISTADAGTARAKHSVSAFLDGRALVVGGATTPATASSQLQTAELYDPGTNAWTVQPPMSLQRMGHTQTTLADGRVLVVGGAWNDGTATATVEIFTPNTLSWSTGAAMSVPRTDHQAVLLSDGRLFVIGGQTLGRRYPVDASTLAYWPIDDAGTSITDIGTNAYTLTASALGTIVNGKVATARNWGAGNQASGNGNATAQNALLADWTVEFWLPPTIAGAANGVVVAYGDANDGTANVNTLMAVGVNGSSRVFWRWENGINNPVTGTQTLGSTVATYTDGCFVALRKRFNGATYDVHLFLNGVLTETWTGLANAAGGSASKWWLNKDPDAAAYYGGPIDEVRVSSIARTDAEILQSYLVSKGWATYLSNPSGEVLASTEFFNPTTNNWSPGPTLSLARSHHRAFVLADGRVVVVGGAGRKLDNPLPTQDNTLHHYWPSSGHTLAEVWDPKTDKWTPAGDARNVWVDSNATFLPTKRQIVVTYGVPGVITYGSGIGAEVSDFEVFDVATMTWRGHFLRNTALNRDVGYHVGSDVILLTGGHTANDTYANADLLIPGADQIAASGMNRVQTVLTASSSALTFKTADQTAYASNYGEAGTIGGQAFDTTTLSYLPVSQYSIASAQRTSNVTTLTMVASSTTGGLAVGQSVFVNLNTTAGFVSGLKTITGLTTTTLTYADVGANIGLTALSGAISIDRNSNATLTRFSATAGTVSDPGPYGFDPKAGLAITSIQTTLAGALQKTQNYSQIQVASNTGFPDTTGFLVFGFGTSKQSKPVKYLEKVGTTILLLDFGYDTEFDYSVGTTVDLLSSRSPYQPGDPLEEANAYVTGSSSGRIAAQSMAQAAGAAGMNIDFTVIYPGDRGLGGEGYPTEAEGSDKLSDAVKVWGGDE